MTDPFKNSSDIKLLEQRVSSVENNMAQKSDIAMVVEEISSVKEGFRAVDKLADKLDKVIDQNTRKEERDRHKEEAIKEHKERLEKLEKHKEKVDIYIAVDEPSRKRREWIERTITMFVIGGILAASFIINK